MLPIFQFLMFVFSLSNSYASRLLRSSLYTHSMLPKLADNSDESIESTSAVLVPAAAPFPLKDNRSMCQHLYLRFLFNPTILLPFSTTGSNLSSAYRSSSCSIAESWLSRSLPI
ncbi:hypothetical protein F5880DRAFT_205319 [Lentinula raphanica]|nr:hypothetical protein F5880DRAFT_205319 [Lentinula raphanica]